MESDAPTLNLDPMESYIRHSRPQGSQRRRPSVSCLRQHRPEEIRGVRSLIQHGVEIDIVGSLEALQQGVLSLGRTEARRSAVDRP